VNATSKSPQQRAQENQTQGRKNEVKNPFHRVSISIGKIAEKSILKGFELNLDVG